MRASKKGATKVNAKPKKRTISGQVDQKTAAALRRIAAEHRWSLSQVVGFAAEEYVVSQRKKRVA